MGGRPRPSVRRGTGQPGVRIRLYADLRQVLPRPVESSGMA
ncbi:DUF6207 family protein [Streptomyces sp. NPDC047043]